MKRRPPRHLIALVAALTLLLAACGSDDEPAAGASPTDAPGAVEDDHGGDDDHDDDHADDEHDAGGEDGATEVSEPELRLLVSDSESGHVVVLDLATGEEIDALDLTGPARLYTEPHGRHVLAAQRDDDLVDWIDAGTWTVGHGDHDHYWTAPPTVTDWAVDAAQPTHVVFHDELLAVFNDGDGSVWVLDTHHLGDDDALVGTWETGTAHHGVAVALESHGVVIVTVVGDDPEDTLPVGVAIIDMETGDELDRFENCPGLHGEAATDDVVAFGCTDGVLVVEAHDGHWHGDKIDIPDGAPADARTGTIHGGHDLDHMIGNLGGGALVRIDLDTASATLIPLPLTAAAWAFDAEADQIVVLTVDGAIHQVDPQSGEIVATIELTDEITLPEGHGGPPRPSILIAGTRAYVADPANGQVIEVAIGGELREARRFDVGFAPLGVAIAGASAH